MGLYGTQGHIGKFLYDSVGSPILERVMGIEPTLSAWEAEVLPLNYTRSARYSTKVLAYLPLNDLNENNYSRKSKYVGILLSFQCIQHTLLPPRMRGVSRN